MTVYLLDVNLLIALADFKHINHHAAHLWFARVGRHGWATCPLVENGFVRIVSGATYSGNALDVQDAIKFLEDACTTGSHEFWPDELTIRGIFRRGVLVPNSQITDAYLVALAAYRKGKLATLDRRIASGLVVGGDAALEIVLV